MAKKDAETKVEQTAVEKPTGQALRDEIFARKRKERAALAAKK